MVEFSKIKGKEFLDQFQKGQGDRIEQGHANFEPDAAEYILGYIFGELYNRKGLDTKIRQLITITVLACKGFAKPQLKYHIGLALDMGITEQEIKEVFLHLTAYDGFPTALTALSAAKEVFQDRQKK